MFATVRLVLGPSHPDAEDVAQEAIVGLIEALPRFRGDCSLAHFAARIALLTAMAARRREQTRSRWVTSEDEVDYQRKVASPVPSPLASLESARRRESIRRLLDALPEALRETMALHLIFGHTAREISLLTRVPVNTVWSRLRLARERLREKVAEDDALRDEFRGVARGP